ncbi:MAG: septum formation protein [Candidatus Azotimanducaceae bacterium]|jgi:septum formation protein|tara:strand:- start:647 stop:1273 length:627 start_codon:yes stop_codon:yes gene_type:complete
MSKKIILGSSSKYRAQALCSLGLELNLDFSQQSPDIDETPEPKETPRALVCRLAQTKAQIIARDNPGKIVIGSDQTGACGDRILEKPGSVEAAIESLTYCSGKTAVFYTGLAIYQCNTAQKNGQTDKYTLDVETTHLQFRKLSITEITDYVERDMPLDCAGSFKAEGLGIALFESIKAEDPSALIGLPLIRLVSRLQEFGFNLLPRSR